MIYNCPICNKLVYDMRSHYELFHHNKFACIKCNLFIENAHVYIKHINDKYHYDRFYRLFEKNDNNDIIDTIKNLEQIPKDIMILILSYVPSLYDDDNIDHKSIVINNSI